MVANTSPPSMLIADAEPYICRVFEAKLTKDNQFAVMCVSTRFDTFQAVLSQAFDVILWDIRLRETHTALPRLRSLCPNAVLILTTTDDRPLLDVQISRLDVADVLVKPLGLDTLASRVHQAMKLPSYRVPVGRLDLATVGQQVLIATPCGECVTRILESSQDYFAVVGAPRVDTPADFVVGQPVRVTVKAKDALYSFGSRLARSHTAPVTHWELPMPRNIRREQRRKYPRRALRLPIELRSDFGWEGRNGALPDARNADAIRAYTTTGRLDALTDDISLGGAALTCNYYLPVDCQVDFRLRDSGVEVSGLAVVVRVQPILNSPVPMNMSEEELQYRIAIRFTHLETPDRRVLRSLLESRP